MKDLSLKALFLIILLAIGYMAGTLAGKGIVAHYKSAPVISSKPTKWGSIVRFVSEGRTFCTGTVVSKNLIVTAAHCVMEETEIGMMARGEIEIRPTENTPVHTKATVVFASPQMDQAMVTGDFRDYQARRIVTDPNELTKLISQDTKFVSCGYPLNGDLYCNETSFSHTQEFFWAVDGTLLPGMSGGPTMLPNGSVVAVNVAVLKDKSIVSPIYNITKNLPRSK